MLEHKVKGDYAVFQEGAVVNIDFFDQYSLTLYDIIDKYSDVVVSVFINIIVLILVLITIIYQKKVLSDYNKIQKTFIISIGVFTLLALIMTNEIINWEYIPKFLWNIQFPWRLCIFLDFGVSVITGFALNKFESSEIRILLFIIVIATCLNDVNYVIEKDGLQVVTPISYEVASDADTTAIGVMKEYLPVKARDNLDYLKNRTEDVIVEVGEATIETIENDVPYLSFSVNIENEESVTVEIPRIFYFGYTIKLETETGEVKNLEYYENDMGFIEFEIEESGIVTVDYTGTTLNKIANIISIILIVMFILYIIIYIINRKKKLNYNLKQNERG